MATVQTSPSKTAAIPKHKARFYVPIKQTVLEVGESFERLGDVLQVTGFPVRIIAVRKPEHIEALLKHPEVGDQKYVRMLPRVKTVMGRGGYILKGGEEWRERRRIVQGAFRRSSFAEYTNRLPGVVDDMLNRWREFARSGAEFDVYAEMNRLITRANFRMFFSRDLDDSEVDRVCDDTHFVQLNFVRVTPLWLPLPQNLRFQACIRRLRAVFTGLIAERKRNPDDRNDLLSVLLDAERNHGWTEDEIVGEIFSVYFGTAVMATTLAWTLYLVASHTEAQQRMIDEAAEVLAGRNPDASDLEQLTYTQAVLQESMRLYPPSWGYPRYCEQGMTLDEYTIPPLTMVIPMVYHTHRHPGLWHNPETFVPERFTDPDADRHPFAHLPFGAGGRICLGAQLAPLVMTLVLAMTAQRYRLNFHPKSADDPVADFGFEIHPRDPIHLTATPLSP